MTLLHSLLLSLAATQTAAVADWPDYRGPRHDGYAVTAGLPLTWSEAENVAWKTAIHGRGWSTPVIAGGRLWMTTATPDGHDLYVVCVDQQSGEVLHDRRLFDVADPAPRHDLNSYASPSPVTDGAHVWVHFGSFGTACLDAATGDTVWTRRDLVIDHIVGPGSSPILLDGRLIFHQDGGDQQYVIALDADTGDTLWRTDRSVDYRDLAPDLRKAYDTPIVIEVDGDQQLLCVGAEATMGYAPDTGAEQWRFRHSGFSMSSRPVVGHGMAFVSTGFNTASLIAIRLGGDGDVTDTHQAWRYSQGVPTMSSPILVGDHLFFVSDGGVLTCLDARTGERAGRRRLDGEFSASPVFADGRLYFANRTGVVTVVEPAPSLDILAENHLEDGLMASPAIAADAFYLRTRSHLYRVQSSVRDV